MRKDLDNALCRDFPLLYRDRLAGKRESCMFWGFDIPDAWEPIVRRLSERLEPMIAALPDDGERAAAAQVKGKFGGLRFYLTDGATDAMYDAVDEAEREVWEFERAATATIPTKEGT